MLDDSPFWCRFAYGRARAPTRRCSGRARRRRRIWKDTGINTHRQHVRIVQSHHRILCNNSNCRRSSLLSLLSSSHAASLSLPRRACVTSPAQSLLSVSQIQNLPLSAPARSVCPANPLPSPPHLLLLLLSWLLSLSLSLTCLLACFSFLSTPPSPLSISLSLSLPDSHSVFSFPLPLAPLLSLYPQPSVLLLCPCLLISSVSSPVLLLSSYLTQIA